MSEIRANNLVNETGLNPVGFSSGLYVGPSTGIGVTVNINGNANFAGIITATTVSATTVNVGGVLTYEDVTNVDSVGVVTARQGIRVGAGKSIGSDGAAAVYYGDGSNLTGIVPNVKVTRVSENNLNGVDSVTYTSLPSGIFEFSYMWYGASLVNNTTMLFRIGHNGGTQTSGYIVAQAEIGDGTDSVTRSPRTGEIPIQTDSWEASPGISNGRIDFQQAGGNTWTWKMQNYYYATSSGHYVNMLNTGFITLGGVLERAVLFTGSGNFDAGKVYLTYKQLVS